MTVQIKTNKSVRRSASASSDLSVKGSGQLVSSSTNHYPGGNFPGGNFGHPSGVNGSNHRANSVSNLSGGRRQRLNSISAGSGVQTLPSSSK